MRPSAIAVTEVGDVSLQKRPDRSAMVGLYLLRAHEEASPRASATLHYAWADPKGRVRALGRAGLDRSQAAARVSRGTYPKPTPDITDIGDPGGLVAPRVILDGPLC